MSMACLPGVPRRRNFTRLLGYLEVVACNALDIVRGYKRIPFFIGLFNVQKSYARLVL